MALLCVCTCNMVSIVQRANSQETNQRPALGILLQAEKLGRRLDATNTCEVCRGAGPTLQIFASNFSLLDIAATEETTLGTTLRLTTKPKQSNIQRRITPKLSGALRSAAEKSVRLKRTVRCHLNTVPASRAMLPEPYHWKMSPHILLLANSHGLATSDQEICSRDRPLILLRLAQQLVRSN